MLTWENDMEVHALRKRGWSISAIARHTGRDRKTVRKYLAGDATPGVRARPSPDLFDPFVDYVSARLVEDPHLWARTLFDELEVLGFELSYQSLTRNIRARDLRPTCAACRSAAERPNAVIEHPPGDEPNGTGWNCPTHRHRGGGARQPICWSDRWPIPGSGARRCRRRWISPISSPRSTT
jgi:transposase